MDEKSRKYKIGLRGFTSTSSISATRMPINKGKFSMKCDNCGIKFLTFIKEAQYCPLCAVAQQLKG